MQSISIHALREEGDVADHRIADLEEKISIHALREEGDRPAHCFPLALIISIHALREEGDLQLLLGALAPEISIHALREEGDLMVQRPACALANFYPRPPRGGRLAETRTLPRLFRISIHALREEGDGNCTTRLS